MKLIHHVIVWGEDYIREFLEVCLPTLLAPGNLPALKQLPGAQFVLWTREKDAEIARSSPMWAEAERIIDCKIVHIDGELSAEIGSKYSQLSKIQAVAIQRSTGFDAFCFIYADSLWADGAFLRGAQIIADGYDAILIYTPKVARDGFLSALQSKYSNAGSGALAIGNKDMARLIIEHLHPSYGGSFFDRPSDGSVAGVVFMSVPGQGLAVRCFHMNTLYVRLLENEGAFFASFSGSYDEDYMNRIAGFLRPYVIKSSDEMFGCTLEGGLADAGLRRAPRLTVHALTVWAELRSGLGHRQFASVPIRWITAAHVDEQPWARVEQEVEEIMAAMRQRLAAPDEQVRLEDPEAYATRLDRRARAGRTRSVEQEVVYISQRDYRPDDPRYLGPRRIANLMILKLFQSRKVHRLHAQVTRYRKPFDIVWRLTRNRFSQKVRSIVLMQDEDARSAAIQKYYAETLEFRQLAKLFLRRLVQ